MPGKGQKSANSSEKLASSTPKKSVNENDVQVNIIDWKLHFPIA